MAGLDEQSEDREIDGITYRVWPLPFGAGKKILLKILRALGGAAGAETDRARVGAILTALSDADIESIGASFGNAASYRADGDNGAPERWVPLVTQNQETHFAGRYDVFLRWVLFAVEKNFGVFFDGARRKAIADDAARLTLTMKT